jgi:hypothetical protein
VELPFIDDFPMIGHVPSEDVEHLEVKIATHLDYVAELTVREALSEFRGWLRVASANRNGLVTFLYTDGRAFVFSNGGECLTDCEWWVSSCTRSWVLPDPNLGGLVRNPPRYVIPPMHGEVYSWEISPSFLCIGEAVRLVVRIIVFPTAKIVIPVAFGPGAFPPDVSAIIVKIVNVIVHHLPEMTVMTEIVIGLRLNVPNIINAIHGCEEDHAPRRGHYAPKIIPLNEIIVDIPIHTCSASVFFVTERNKLWLDVPRVRTTRNVHGNEKRRTLPKCSSHRFLSFRSEI